MDTIKISEDPELGEKALVEGRKLRKDLYQKFELENECRRRLK
jgi:hypothetical protein